MSSTLKYRKDNNSLQDDLDPGLLTSDLDLDLVGGGGGGGGGLGVVTVLPMLLTFNPFMPATP